MLCPSCHRLNRENARFCKDCGQPLVVETVIAAEQAQGTIPTVGVSGQAQGTVPTEAASVPVEDDLSLAPTQVITPAQMMQYHSRRWQQEVAHEQRQVDTHDSGGESSSSAISQGQSQQASAQGALPTVYDVADTPTIIVAAKDTSAQSGKEAPEVPQVLSDEQRKQENEKPDKIDQQESEKPEQATSFAEEKSMKNDSQSANAEDAANAAVPTGQQANQAFPVLSIGTKINDRYEVTQVVKSEQDEHVYEVLDHKGYLHCWSCDSTDNAEGDEYCANCGAQLFEVTYLMHEYPATPSSTVSQEANVIQLKIVDTVIENGHTYAIEQPQDEQDDFPNGVHLLAACDSDAGNLRRSEPNEDSTLVLLLQRVHESLASPAGIFLVADGLGGHSNGQYASRVAVNVIADRVVRDLLLAPLSAEKEEDVTKQWDEESLLGLLQGAIEDANTTICQLNQRDKSDMGCTLTGVMIADDRAYIFNVGDSRTYILRDGKIYQLTKDHSLVGQLVEGGLIEPDDVYSHPQRSQIYRSIGDKLNVQIDLFKQQIHPGDMLLSCSDGLWEMVRDPQIAEILNAAPDPQTASRQLIETANTNGGEDNVSAVVVFVR
jgi:serine/threonine protein phosphatase PrpC